MFSPLSSVPATSAHGRGPRKPTVRVMSAERHIGDFDLTKKNPLSSSGGFAFCFELQWHHSLRRSFPGLFLLLPLDMMLKTNMILFFPKSAVARWRFNVLPRSVRN